MPRGVYERKPFSEEHRLNLSKSHIGREVSNKTKLIFAELFRGNKNPRWNGGKKNNKGYIMIHNPSHPFSGYGGYVCEHRLVMEKHTGRYLLPTEVVHHINGITNDNRKENLMLFKNNEEHIKHHKMERRLKQ